VLAKSVRDTGTQYPLAVLVTPESVSEASRSELKTLFNHIILVDPISGLTKDNLAIIGRPDLHATLTKLHLWSLTQYSRVLYLDADTLVLQNVDHLLESLESFINFAAAPELGFPDCFNAGVMVLTPNKRTYSDLRQFATVHDSFDGGDQGILNVFFGDGTRGHPSKGLLSTGHKKIKINVDNTNDTGYHSPPESEDEEERNWFRLSFTYNMEMHKVYRYYIPAVLRYRDEHKILHFIGKDKPWHFPDGHVETPDDANAYFGFYAEMVSKWWEVRQSISSTM
jgi:glycogenin glucosyltransferase